MKISWKSIDQMIGCCVCVCVCVCVYYPGGVFILNEHRLMGTRHHRYINECPHEETFLKNNTERVFYFLM